MKSMPVNLYRTLMDVLPDRLSQSIQFTIHHRKVPRLSNPQTFSERIVWRKLHWTDGRFVGLADKLAVKAHISQKLGSEWVTPTLWQAAYVPNRLSLAFPYVLKANHGTQMVAIVRNKADEVKALRDARCWLDSLPVPKRNLERWYENIPPRVFAEPFLSNDGKPPVDYKFFCFHGKVALVEVFTGRFNSLKRSHYTPNWRRLRISRDDAIEANSIKRPDSLDNMLSAAAELSKGFDFVRVDFYETDTGPRFSELTFAPASGWRPFRPVEVEEWLGRLWAGESLDPPDSIL